MQTQHDAFQTKKTIRVVLGNIPEVLAQLMAEEIARQPDMTLIAIARDNLDVLQAMHKDVDLVVLGAKTTYPPPGILSNLLNEFPHLRALVIATNDDSVQAYWLGLYHGKLENEGVSGVMNNIREIYNIDMTAVD